MKKKNKAIKVSTIIISTLILLGIITYAATELILEPYLKKKIKENVQKFANVEYIIRFEDLDLQAFRGNLFLQQVEIVPRKKVSNTSSDSYKILLDNLSIEEMDVLDYIFNEKINIAKINLPHGHLNLHNYIKETQQENSSETSAIKGTVTIEEVNIAALEVQDGKFTITNVDDKGQNELISCFVTLQMEKINFSFGTSLMESFNYDKLSFKMKNLNGKSTDSLRSFSIKSAEITNNNNSYYATIDNVAFGTRVEKYALSDILGHEGDWINVNFPSADITDWHMYPFLTGEKFEAGTIHIKAPEVSVFRDKRAPFPDKKDTKLPNDFIKNLSYKFSIDTVKISNGTITYQEHVQAMEEPGYITFNAFYASIHNITNDTAIIDKNGDTAYMYANSKVMDSTELKAEFTFPLVANAKNHAKGSVSKVRLATFNPMLAQVGYAKIESGVAHSLDFDFTYDNSSATGEMKFIYEDLEIKTISKNDGESESVGQEFKSFIADFVVDDENTEDNLRMGKIEYSRNKKKSIINYWWKSLLTGIRTSIGLSGDVKSGQD